MKLFDNLTWKWNLLAFGNRIVENLINILLPLIGDSGSMLLANGEVVGVVVSGVRLCGQVDAAPDIYTRVSSYISWIEGYIHDLN